MALTEQQIEAGRTLLAERQAQNLIPKFNHKDQDEAEAFVAAVNDCFPEPVMEIEVVTTFKLINKLNSTP